MASFGPASSASLLADLTGLLVWTLAFSSNVQLLDSGVPWVFASRAYSTSRAYNSLPRSLFVSSLTCC